MRKKLLAQNPEDLAARMQAVADALPEGLIIADRAGNITMMNSTALAIHGFESVEEARRLLRERPDLMEVYDLQGRRLSVEEQPLACACAGTAFSGLELRVRRKDTGTTWIGSYSGASMQGESGAVTAAIVTLRDITQRAQAESSLRESETTYRELVENANSIILKYDRNGKITFFNRCAQSFFGYREDEILGKDVMILVPREDTNGVSLETLSRDILENPDGYAEYVNENVLRTGERVWISWRNEPIKDSSGAVIGNCAMGQDITARRKAEQALRLSEERYRSLFESMTQGVVYQDAEGKIITANHSAEVMLGLPLEQMKGRTSSDPRWRAIHEDGSDFPGDTHPAMIALRTGVPVRGVVMGVFNPRSDEYRWLRVDGVPQFRPGERKPYQVYTLFDDITEGKRVQDELKWSEERFSTLYSSMTEGVALHDVLCDSSGNAVDYIVIDVNPAYERITGLSRDGVAGRKASEIYGTGLPPYLDVYARVASSGVPESFETYFAPMRKCFGISVFSPAKGRFATVFRDITDRRLAEAQSREARDYLENLFNYANAPIIVWDSDLKITRFNHAFERLTGRRADEVLGKELELLFPEGAREESLALVRRAMAGERLETVEIPIQSVDGRIHTVLWNSAALFGSDGKTPVATIAQGQDITQRKLVEEERQELLVREQEARREAEAASRAKDEFLAVLSHELRTPLTAVLGWVKMLQSGRLNAATAALGLEVIERSVKAQSRLIEDLLDVSRIIAGKLKLEKTIVDLSAIVQATIEWLQPTAHEKHVNLRYCRGASSVPFDGDAARLQQVVWNLVSNAIKFTPQGGRVDVDLVTADGQAVLTVADTGNGIKPEFLPQLFSRFTQEDSSTTRRYTGLGLGLAIVRHIVELHGGKADAESEGEGKGARFRVTLPLPAAIQLVSPPRTVDIAAGDARPLEGVKVLFVEDDKDLLELAGEILRMSGAECELAGGVPDALAAFERMRPDVLVSDIGLPGEDGYSLMCKIRARERERQMEPVRSIAMTGYAQVEDRARVYAAGYEQHLAKPVDPDVLIAAIVSIARKPI